MGHDSVAFPATKIYHKFVISTFPFASQPNERRPTCR